MYGVPPEYLPDIRESTDVVGAVHARAAAETGFAEGTPVVAGAGDFPADAVSTGVSDEGEVRVTYGTTLNVLAFARRPLACPGLYVGPSLLGGLAGLYAGLRGVWGGMATSAAVTRWFRDNFGQSDYDLLSLEPTAFRLALMDSSWPCDRALLEGIGYLR